MRTVVFWLSLVLIFLIPLEESIPLEGFGSVTKVVGISVAAFWGLTIVSMDGFRKPHPFHIVVYFFLCWNIVSIFWSVDVDKTVDRLLTYFQLALLVYILWDTFTSPRALKAGLQAYVLGAYVPILGTVANYLAGYVGPDLRFTATGLNPNELGLTLALGIPVAWHLAISESFSGKTSMLRLVNFSFLPAATLTILLTGSRGSLVAALPGFLFVIASLPRLSLFARLLVFTSLAVALFALQPLVPQSSFDRFATIGTSIADLNLTGRVDIWLHGLTFFLEHPFFGIGSGSFQPAIGRASHNAFLSVLVETGIVGFTLFSIILAITVYQVMRQPKWDSRFWLAVLLVWFLGSLVHNWEYKKPTWLFLGLAIVSASLSVSRDVSTPISEFGEKLKAFTKG